MSIISKSVIDRCDHWEFYMISRNTLFLGGIPPDAVLDGPQLRIVVNEPTKYNKLGKDLANALLNTKLTPVKFDIGDFRYVIRLYHKDTLLCQIAVDGTRSVARVDKVEGYIDGKMKQYLADMESFFL